MKRRLSKFCWFPCLMAVLMVFASTFSFANASSGITPYELEGGGGSSGLSREVSAQDYDYPGGSLYAYMSATVLFKEGIYQRMVKSYVGSNLVGFSYDDPSPTKLNNGRGVSVSTNYVGWGENWRDFYTGDLEVTIYG